MPLSVRLSSPEIDALRATVSKVFDPAMVLELYLFGSRTDLKKRGGDIDLWIELKTAPADPIRLASEFRIELFSKIEEQKVDLKITGPFDQINDAPTLSFLNLVKPSMIPLWSNRNTPIS